MRRAATLSSLVGTLLIVAGCGSGGDSGNVTGQKAGFSEVTFSASSFPTADGVMAGILASGSYTITLKVGGEERRAILTPTSPSTTLTDLPIGDFNLTVSASDGTQIIDYYQATGKLVEGINTIPITMLKGTWILSSPLRFNKTYAPSENNLTGLIIAPMATNTGSVDYNTTLIGGFAPASSQSYETPPTPPGDYTPLTSRTTHLGYTNTFEGPSTMRSALGFIISSPSITLEKNGSMRREAYILGGSANPFASGVGGSLINPTNGNMEGVVLEVLYTEENCAIGGKTRGCDEVIPPYEAQSILKSTLTTPNYRLDASGCAAGLRAIGNYSSPNGTVTYDQTFTVCRHPFIAIKQ
ncbi:MAG: hypothetical protein K6347_04100 [Campylobacterales bacterium]